MPIIKYGTTEIYYTLYKEKRNDLKITVNLINGVEVHAPADKDEVTLSQLLHKKAAWILQKIEDLNEVKASVQPIEFVSGEKLPYLGRNYRLKVYNKKVKSTSIQFQQGRFIAEVPEEWPQDKIQFQLERAMIAWYKKHGTNKVVERSKMYQDIMNVRPKSIKLKSQLKRWGTCTENGDIYLNWQLAMAPVRVIDYVIVHELAHLIELEHNDRFWRIVRNTLPHYKASKDWLRVHGMALHSLQNRQSNDSKK
ncbi:M48 family metallopeptidase [Salinicoccus albus]|uniref:M48 family metallopeptidase n=1 Tax=Salinicoccus albus TaxID=418756 RepID=UPI000361A733|nr:SprT family zinc-dependent metalloprotease [Salinicoccus albus]